MPAPDEMRHLVVMPIANEDYSIIQESLDEILATDYRKDRVMLCLTFEERSKVWTPEKIARIEAEYGPKFAMVMTTRHPDGLPGEGRVKGANISWGAQLARQELHRRGLRDEQIIVSAFDADTRPSHNYFQVLTYSYLTNPGRDIDSYQPVLLFHNNVWDVTAASRLVGYIASMWTLVDSTRPERLRIFSSHAMGMTALVGVNFWSRNVIPDDSRQFWRMFYGTEGRAKTVPLHVSVYLDGVDANGFWRPCASSTGRSGVGRTGSSTSRTSWSRTPISPKIPLGLRVAADLPADFAVPPVGRGAAAVDDPAADRHRGGAGRGALLVDGRRSGRAGHPRLRGAEPDRSRHLGVRSAEVAAGATEPSSADLLARGWRWSGSRCRSSRRSSSALPRSTPSSG